MMFSASPRWIVRLALANLRLIGHAGDDDTITGGPRGRLRNLFRRLAPSQTCRTCALPQL
jgi:hypothetical protein